MDDGRMKKNGHRDKLREFFKANPDEELTIEDICIKCNISPNSARMVVWGLMELGELKSFHVYRAVKK
jgi:hypothetical protein